MKVAAAVLSCLLATSGALAAHVNVPLTAYSGEGNLAAVQLPLDDMRPPYVPVQPIHVPDVVPAQPIMPPPGDLTPVQPIMPTRGWEPHHRFSDDDACLTVIGASCGDSSSGRKLQQEWLDKVLFGLGQFRTSPVSGRKLLSLSAADDLRPVQPIMPAVASGDDDACLTVVGASCGSSGRKLQQKIFKKMGKAFTSGAKSIGKGFEDAGNAINQEVVRPAAKGLESGVKSVGNFGEDAVKTIGNGFEDAGNAIHKEVLKPAAKWIKNIG